MDWRWRGRLGIASVGLLLQVGALVLDGTPQAESAHRPLQRSESRTLRRNETNRRVPWDIHARLSLAVARRSRLLRGDETRRRNPDASSRATFHRRRPDLFLQRHQQSLARGSDRRGRGSVRTEDQNGTITRFDSLAYRREVSRWRPKNLRRLARISSSRSLRAIPRVPRSRLRSSIRIRGTASGPCCCSIWRGWHAPTASANLKRRCWVRIGRCSKCLRIAATRFTDRLPKASSK